MATKTEIRQWISDIRAAYPLIALGTTEEYVSGIEATLKLFEREFCGEDGVRKE